MKGYPDNSQDFVYQAIGDGEARESVTKDLTPVKGSRIGELAVRFDILLGVTPEDDHAN